MTQRAVYDAMVFLQWAARPSKDQQHATVTALTSDQVRLCMSPELVAEVRTLLSRAELQTRLPALSPERVGKILAKVIDEYSDWFAIVPKAFSLPRHPKDDHLFNLAIAAEARYLVTWEDRLLRLDKYDPAAAKQLSRLAPNLQILDPPSFSRELRQQTASPQPRPDKGVDFER